MWKNYHIKICLGFYSWYSAFFLAVYFLLKADTKEKAQNMSVEVLQNSLSWGVVSVIVQKIIL